MKNSFKEERKDNRSITAVGLLYEWRKKPILQKFLARNSLSALDIGCGLPENLFPLYHDFNFDFLECVDSLTEEEAIKNRIDVYKEIRDTNPKRIYDVYKHLDVKKADVKSRRKILSEADFTKIFKTNFEMDFEDYSTDRKYDFIILSNILHLIEAKKEFFDKAKSLLKKSGMIYVRVNHKEKLIRQHTFTDRELSKMVKRNFKEIYSCRIMSPDNKSTNSLIYLGSKK